MKRERLDFLAANPRYTKRFAFYVGKRAWLGPKKSARIRLAVMDMWKPFRLSTERHAPDAAISFDKFHVLRHLGDALDKVRKSEYARLTGKDRRFIVRVGRTAWLTSGLVARTSTALGIRATGSVISRAHPAG